MIKTITLENGVVYTLAEAPTESTNVVHIVRTTPQESETIALLICAHGDWKNTDIHSLMAVEISSRGHDIDYAFFHTVMKTETYMTIGLE